MLKPMAIVQSSSYLTSQQQPSASIISSSKQCLTLIHVALHSLGFLHGFLATPQSICYLCKPFSRLCPSHIISMYLISWSDQIICLIKCLIFWTQLITSSECHLTYFALPHIPCTLEVILSLDYTSVFFFLSFLGPHPLHMEVPSRGPVRAIAAGLCHSYSNTRSQPHLRPTTAHGNAHRPRPGMEPTTFVSAVPWQELQKLCS